MKPKYTVRLTGELDQEGRQRVAERVAGVTDIDADKIERLLERGEGKDLIKPSSANVANRLASVLAEAGAPVQLVPVTEGAPTEREVSPAEDVEAVPEAQQPVEAPPAAREEEEALLRPRRAPEATPADHEEREVDSALPPAEPEPSPTEAPAPAQPRTVSSERTEPEPEPEPIAAAAETQPPGVAEPEFEPEFEAEPEPVAEPEPQPEPVAARPVDRPAETNRGTAVLGAVGAALLGIGAFLSMGFLVDGIAIGILVLAVMALGLSLVGRRRAIWLPGAGAIALLVWALANADAGVMAALANHWQWFAMIAGALLVTIAGAMEAQRGHGL